MTETAGSGTLSAVHKGPLRPVPNVEMMVVDAEHNPLGPGEMGELVFIGPCVARGRWQLPSLPDDHLYSGDVGYMDEQGNVYVVDRLKDIINRGGEKIFPIQIEKVIMEYPGVSKAAVYAVSSEIYGEVPAAAIIPEQGAHINPVEVKEYLRTRIATYEMPDLIEIVSEFPVTQNGKVRKAELRRRTEEGGW
jgi:acyl-CoA synthetase (AMP-forming)/AMP-acid ligase II